MDNVMISRLRAITEQLKGFSTEAVVFTKESGSDNERIEVLVAKLDTTINRFTVELHNYFRLCQEPASDEISEFSNIQLNAEEILAELKTILNREKSKSSIQLNETSLSRRLPKADLPVFEGNILEWTTFFDQFNSNIGTRNLPDVDKLLYLKLSLKGDALMTIDGLEITSKNYSIALSLLKERYGKENRIIDAHYSALYNIKPSDKIIQNCRKTLMDIERHLRVLKSLGENINHNHLRFVIMGKFPEELIYEMRMRTQTDSIEEIRKQLEIIITAKEDASRITKEDNIKEVVSCSVETLYVNDDKSGNLFRNRYRTNKSQPTVQHNPFNSNFKRSFTNKDKQFEPTNKRRKPSCGFCGDEHYSDECSKLKTVEERKKHLDEMKKCYRCLKPQHMRKNCLIGPIQCHHCTSIFHHRALCPKRNLSNKVPDTSTALHLVNKESSSTILKTAVIKIIHPNEIKPLKCRVVLDSGSQKSYITEKVFKNLQLPIEEENILSVFTFGSRIAQELESPLVRTQISTKSGKWLEVFANVVPIITNSVIYPKEFLEGLKERFDLADDGSLMDQVDMLIGNDYFDRIISTKKIEIQEIVFLVESLFGWILSGKPVKRQHDGTLVVHTYFQSHMENKLTQPDLPLESDGLNLKSLWELESIGITDSPKICRDEEAIKKFNETTKIINNRYTVSWPWIEYPPTLSTNYGLAYGRLITLLKRLDTEALIRYDQTLGQQLELGVIEPVLNPHNPVDHPVHYHPHHGVVVEGKPIRIVYDASAKVKGEKSLNECLYCGPIMLEDLTTLLLRFRSHRVGISADVEKAFLQVSLHQKDRDVTRFLWIKDITKPATEDNIIHMRFTRVPFGIISSPFLLNATVRHHLTRSEKEVVKSIVNDIYVDNLITGTETVEQAIQLYKECRETFQEISMNLRQWSCNSKEVMQHISEVCDDETVKVLGLDWNLENDTLSLRFKNGPYANTKRGILRTTATIYDPCGFVTPLVLPAKLLLQELWKRKSKWDSALPQDITEKWKEIKSNFSHISEATVPRFYFETVTEKGPCSLHCFADASMQAYAAVIYIVNGKDKSFVIGKSRLAPLKNQDSLKIPKLELLGVLIGSRLIKYVVSSLKLNVTKLYLWTDSQIVIEWCKSDKLLTPFVARRISEIKSVAKLEIKYVPSKMNPADVATRPVATHKANEIWLNGPEFLIQNDDKWPTGISCLLAGEGPSFKSTDTEDKMDSTILESCPSFESMEARDRIDLTVGESSNHDNDTNDLDFNGQTRKESIMDMTEDHSYNMDIDKTVQSEMQKIKDIQLEYFPDEMKGKQTNLYRNLGLFLDVDGLLRCKGRMMHADWSFDQKHPILLPKNCEFTLGIIRKIHEENYHVGVSHTLSIIRKRFWILQGRAQVQKVLRQCSKCVKHGGGPYRLPVTPDLPPSRVTYEAPFVFTGLDYFGPIIVKTDSNQEKRWICLFTCLVVRSIHMEVVKDMSAEECLLALRRFVSSRGVPALILSDNATYFKLTADVMTNEYCVKNKTKWQFIPELAPWHGGVYERLVGVVKHCLRRSLDKHLLNDSQLQTVIKEVETVVNTRPLTSVGANLEYVLKPLDFLSLGKCISFEEAETQRISQGSTIKTDLIAGWRRGLNFINEFKEMFINQYLQNLRERYNNEAKQSRIKSQRTPCVGDIVQIKGESKNRLGWKVGTITAITKSADGQYRVAKVKVGNNEYTRSIGHLYPLEADLGESHKVLAPEPKLGSTGQLNNQDLLTSNLPIDLGSISEQDPEHEETMETNDSAGTETTASEHPSRESLQEMQPRDNNQDDPNSGQLRPRREAAVRALQKIKEWTQNFLTLL